jgi:threonine dehydrogenase-like Zn-dependent dehydrogenase
MLGARLIPWAQMQVHADRVTTRGDAIDVVVVGAGPAGCVLANRRELAATHFAPLTAPQRTSDLLLSVI